MPTKGEEVAGLAEGTSALGRIWDEEPIFILRGRDRWAPMATRVWLQVSLEHGLTWDQQETILELLREFETWQRVHHMDLLRTEAANAQREAALKVRR